MATTAVESDRPKRKPAWMSIPGGPKEPNFADFRTKLQSKSAEKTKCFDRLNELRDLFSNRGDDEERVLVNKEQQQMRERLKEIENQRKQERDKKRGKDEQLQRVKKERLAIETQLKELSQDLGAFKELEDIEAAIERVMYKMETGGSNLKNEKLAIKRLSQLEQAKSLVLQLQPLTEAQADFEERESELQQEYRETIERIAALNKQYEVQAGIKAEKDKSVKKQGTDRSALVKEREEIRAKIAAINQDMDTIRSKFEAEKEAWAKWKEEAIEKHRVQVEAQRAEREKKIREREAQRKAERKIQKALKRLNPYENEIDCCSNLIRYLEDKVNMSKRDKEKEAQRKRAAAFDPHTAVPEGAKLKEYEDDWLFGDRTKKTGAKPKAKVSTEADEKPQKQQQQRDRYLQHTVDKFRSFELVGVEIPMTTAAVAGALEELKKKKKEYETHIVDPSTLPDEDSEDENDEAQPAAADE